MKTRLFGAMSSIVIVTAHSGFAQSPVPSAKCANPDVSTVDAFGPKTASEARSFLANLQNAVRTNNRTVVASMMRFPLRASDGQKQILIKTKTEFLNQYDHLWTKDLVKALLSQDAACLSYASSGYTPEMGSQTDFVIGSKGEIWFGSQGETDSLKVITLNN